jgi:hypothetical protein
MYLSTNKEIAHEIDDQIFGFCREYLCIFYVVLCFWVNIDFFAKGNRTLAQISKMALVVLFELNVYHATGVSWPCVLASFEVLN